MSNVNFHQFFSAELKEFHAILVFHQESYSKLIKENTYNSEFDETETLVKLKETIDTASQFFRGFSDLLAEGKMEKIKMNIQAILAYINSSNNTYLKDYTKLFDEALERLAELTMIVEPTIQNENGEIIFEKNIEIPYESDVTYAINSLNQVSYILVGGGFVFLLAFNLMAVYLFGDGFVASGLILQLNIICIFCLVFGFKAISTLLLEHKLEHESNQSFVENVGKLISEYKPTRRIAEISYKNTDSQGRAEKIRKKRDQENQRQTSSFDKVAFNTTRRSSESKRTTSSSSTTHSGYENFYNSGNTYSSSESSSDSSSNNCDSGSSGGGYD